jgi:hypothetical protein
MFRTSPMRPEATDLSLGFGTLRWADSKHDVGRLFPGAKPTHSFEGRDPYSGERCFLPAGKGLVLERFRRMGNVSLTVLADFEDQVLQRMAVSSEPAEVTDNGSDTDGDRWSGCIAACIAQLGRELGFGPITEMIDQSWAVKGCRVELFLETGEFTLTIHRPAGLP